MAHEFLDTNVVVYAFSDDPRAAVAQDLLARRCHISVQVLDEFTHVARRKLGFDWNEVSAALADIRLLCDRIHPLELDTHDHAIALAERYGFSIYDALIVASALKAGCDILHSEDVRDGLVVEGRLRIANPFRPNRS